MHNKNSATIVSPAGTVYAVYSDKGIHRISFEKEEEFPLDNAHPVAVAIQTQLAEYFSGSRKTFDLPLIVEGTPFQKNVWKTLSEIPYGSTMSYVDFAVKCKAIKSVRAVATANGKNKHLIVVPCHRVLGSDGSLTGYSGNLERKKLLLDLEQKYSGQSYQLGLGL